jgi:hypothetical protein
MVPEKEPKLVRLIWQLFPKSYLWMMVDSMRDGAKATAHRLDRMGLHDTDCGWKDDDGEMSWCVTCENVKMIRGEVKWPEPYVVTEMPDGTKI